MANQSPFFHPLNSLCMVMPCYSFFFFFKENERYILIQTRLTLLGRAELHRIFSSLSTLNYKQIQIKRLPSLSSVLNMIIKGDVCTPGTYMLYTTLPQ